MNPSSRQLCGKDVQVLTSEQWRATSRYAIDNKLEFYTHSLTEDKKFRIVIRDLRHSIPIAHIKTELQTLGFNCVNAMNIRGKNDELRSLFFIDLSPQPNNREIFNIKRLCPYIIKIEEHYRNKHMFKCNFQCDIPGTGVMCHPAALNGRENTIFFLAQGRILSIRDKQFAFSAKKRDTLQAGGAAPSIKDLIKTWSQPQCTTRYYKYYPSRHNNTYQFDQTDAKLRCHTAY